jgi:pectate lyase
LLCFGNIDTDCNSISYEFSQNFNLKNLKIMKVAQKFLAIINMTIFVSLFSLNQGFTQTGGFANVSIGGTTVTVSNATDLKNYMTKSGQYTIKVKGTISLSGMNKVSSNKAIIGVGTSAKIKGGGLNISGVSNVVVQNISFSDWDDDAVNIQNESKNIWVDHCSFSNGADGCVDVKRGSDYVTVSWNKFSNHQKTCLLGHSNSNGSQDKGHLRVTYHHNYFNGTGSRHPRVRFSALCHVYNNYYVGNDYGVASTCEAEVLVEGNYFKNVDDPTLVGYASSPDGDLVQRNNKFSGSGTPESSGSVPNPPYSYSMDNASNIPSIVSNGAGANGTTGGDDDDDDNQGDAYIEASASAGNGYVALTWSIHNITNTGTEIYRDTDSDPSGRVRIASVGSSTSYTDNSVSNGTTYYYWIKVKDSDGTYYNSDAIKASPSGGSNDPYIDASASAGNGSVALSWSIHNITNTGTEIYRDTDSDPSGRVRIASVGSSTSYTDNSVSNGTTYYYWIKVKDSDGTYYNSDAIKASPSSTKSAEENLISDGNMNLTVFPNPFISSTTISFNLEEEQNVSLSIYNMSGKLIDKTENLFLQSGMNELTYENRGLSNGMYNMTIHFKDRIETIKLLVK